MLRRKNNYLKLEVLYWVCDFDCGNSISVSSESLKNGKTSCGCEEIDKMSISGLKVGRLTVKNRSDKKSKNGDYYWYCDCDCGKKDILIVRSSLVSKRKYRTLSCGCYKNSGEHVVNKESDRLNHIKKYLYGKLKIRNKKLGFSNNEIIGFEVFSEMIMQPCYYCGLENGNKSYDTEAYETNYQKKKDYRKHRVSDEVLYHNGIDRIDSKIGYVEGNVISCCKYCNMAKMDRSQEEFLKWAEHTYQYFVQGIRENP